MNWKQSIQVVCLAWAMGGCKTPAQVSEGPKQTEAVSVVGKWLAEEVVITFDLSTNKRQLPPKRPDGRMMTIIQPDGSFLEQKYASSDTLQSSKKGFWHAYGDSLFMNYEEVGAARARFGLAVDAKQMRLTQGGDLDGDGQKDDQMVISLRKED